MQRLVKESIMYGLPGTPAPGTLDFPSFEVVIDAVCAVSSVGA